MISFVLKFSRPIIYEMTISLKKHEIEDAFYYSHGDMLAHHFI